MEVKCKGRGSPQEVLSALSYAVSSRSGESHRGGTTQGTPGSAGEAGKVLNGDADSHVCLAWPSTITSGMVYFMCQFDWTNGCSEIW